MAKAKGKAPTRKKGGQPSAEVVKKSITNPDAQTEEDLDEIFGSEVEDMTTDEGVEEEFDLGDSHIEVKPKVEVIEDDSDEGEEPEEEEEDTTQAAEEEEEEETPSSLDQADLMGLLPKKFQGEDLKESLSKWSKSSKELESRQDRLEQELAQATKILKAVTPVQKPVPKPEVKLMEGLDPAEEEALLKALGEIDILDDPITPLKTVYALSRRAALQDAQSQIGQYDALKTRLDQFNAFKAGHSDFDSLKNEMLEVIEANPHLDSPEMVEAVYNKAKELRVLRTETQTKETVDSVIGSEQLQGLLDRIKQAEAKAIAAEQAQKALIEKIRTGQAVKGTLTSGSSQTPTLSDRTGAGEAGKKKFRIVTDHGVRVTDDEELAGIIAAERYEDQDLLNL